jgi:hypothetical protein
MRRPSLGPWLGFLLLLLTACTPSAEDQRQSAAEIEAFLADYLPRLTAVYETGNAELLRGLAAEKEMAHLVKLISDRAAQGQVLVPELRRVTLESHSVWSHVNAFATTVEVWDLRLYSNGEPRTLLREMLQQPSRVKYQLKKIDGKWHVLFRETTQVVE